MKLDDEVKMISAEAPIVFAKAAEMFIQEVTIRAWLHTEENKRRTLQVKKKFNQIRVQPFFSWDLSCWIKFLL